MDLVKKFLELFSHREPTPVTAKHRSPTNERKRRREAVAVEEVVERKFFADLHSGESSV